MPCDSVILNRVDMPKMHPDLTGRALSEMGATNVRQSGNTIYFRFQGNDYTLAGGELQSYDASRNELGQVADQLKRHYSVQVVHASAAANGWTVQQTGQFAYRVIKSR